MTGRIKRQILIMITAAALFILILDAALPHLDLQPGMPLPSLNNGEIYTAPSGNEPISASVSVNLFFQVLFGLLLTASLFYLVYKLIIGVPWRDYWRLILKTLGYTAGVFFLLFLIFFILTSKAAPSTLMEPPLPTPEPEVRTPLGPVPPILMWIVGIILIGGVTLLGVWIYETFSKKPDSINLLGLEAERARQALLTGENVKDVILRCYQQMGLALKAEQGIERMEYMTPREFERQLDALGMPVEPIHHLTQLFEVVRYGHWSPNPVDEQKALACLDAIVQYSREMKQADGLS